jgi:hypothetical protein
MVGHLDLEDAIDFLADGMKLPATVAGDEHEIVELGRHPAHIEHDDVLSAMVFGGARGGEGELFAPLVASFETGRSASDDGLGLSDALDRQDEFLANRGPILAFCG